jgi:hypothetical protein
MQGKKLVLHAIGFALIGAGIAFWITGLWYGPGLFFGGLVVETVGYFVARRSELTKSKDLPHAD